MKIWLRLVYADGDVATMAMELRFRCAFVSFFNIEPEIPIRFSYDLGASTALLLRYYCALVVSVTTSVILTKISNRSGIAVQWNVGFSSSLSAYIQLSLCKSLFSLKQTRKPVLNFQSKDLMK